MTVHLCTYFDSRYLAKGLALLRSCARHLPAYHVYVLALDDWAFEVVAALADRNVTVLRLADLARETDLEALRQGRSWKEFIWSLTPLLPRLVLQRFGVEAVAYIDADCYLFADLAPLYAEVTGASIAVIPHRWTPRHAARLRANGLFNVGWVFFRHDPVGQACLDAWWRDCRDWRPDVGRPFSDQVFLDGWPETYGAALRSITHLGANVAPWNQEQYEYMQKVPGGPLWLAEPGRIDADGIVAPTLYPLLFYHFHEFSIHPDGTLTRTGYPLAAPIQRHVYVPYETEIRDVLRLYA